MTGSQSFLTKLHQNLNTLLERKAKYGDNPPLELLNQIADHEEAIALTEQAANGEIGEAEWREALAPLLIAIEARPGGESASSVTLGDIEGGIRHSAIAGRDVTQLTVNVVNLVGQAVTAADVEPAAREMLNLVLAQVGAVAPMVARKYPQNPQGYTAPLQDALAELLAADRGLAARLDALLSRYEQAATYYAEVGDGGAVAQGEGNVVAAGGSVAVGRDVAGSVITGRGNKVAGTLIETQNITFAQPGQQVGQQVNVAGDYYAGKTETGSPGLAALDDTTALARYLGHVIEANRRLQLQGIRSAGELVSIDLEQVYITLTTTRRQQVAEEAAWLDDQTRLAPGEGRRAAAPRETEMAVKVQAALADHPRLVVLGDPGCGKTTLLRYLAVTYARDLAGESGLVRRWLDLAEQRLPILLPLRDFARYLAHHYPDPGLDGPKLLLDYLRTYFANQEIALPERFFADRLQTGAGVVLLDGVDEVADLATRQRIARIIERFTIAYPANRYVITSRLVGYTGSARLGEGYTIARVRDFSLEDINRFVTYWNLAVEMTLARGDTPTARQLANRHSEALLRAIQNNERVRELAVNPLLLTVIALVQRYRAQLPERRTELYEEAIEVLLGSWDVAKGLAAKTMMAGRELDAGDRRSMLQPIALWMMEQRVREIETTELRRQLGQQFYEIVGDQQLADQAVDDFVRLINERSGLLVERGHGLYSFSHLTFQKHLAARAVAARPDYIAYTLARLGDSWWREVILLEAGYLSIQDRRRVTPLLRAMVDYKTEPEPYHNLILTAECLRDVGLARVEGDLWAEVQGRLRRHFEQPLRKPARSIWRTWLGRQPNLTDLIRRRAAAAEALGRIESGGPSGGYPTASRCG